MVDFLYKPELSLMAVAAPEAKSNTPTTGLVTVPTTPLPKPDIIPCMKTNQ